MIQELIKKIARLFNVDRNSKKDLGEKGEALVANYIRKTLGYKIVDRNWRHKNDEIDIIAKDQEVLVFIEVKTRRKSELIAGYRSVTKRKKDAIRRSAKNYLRKMREKPKHLRFDIVVVKFFQDNESIIQQYKNVPLFSKNFHAIKND